MINRIVFVMAFVFVLGSVSPALAQQDADGDGLYEVCVLSSGEHEGQINFSFAVLSAEEMASSNISHMTYYQPNADGSCPTSPEAGIRIPRESLPPVTASEPPLTQPDSGLSVDEAATTAAGGDDTLVTAEPTPTPLAPITTDSIGTTANPNLPLFVCGLRLDAVAPYEGRLVTNDAELDTFTADFYEVIVESDQSCPEGVYELVWPEPPHTGIPGYYPVRVDAEPLTITAPSMPSNRIGLAAGTERDAAAPRMSIRVLPDTGVGAASTLSAMVVILLATAAISCGGIAVSGLRRNNG